MSDDSWGGIGDEYTDSSETSETSNNSDSHETNETDEASQTGETIGTQESTESADSRDAHGFDGTSETSNTHETSETSNSGKTNIREEWNGRTLYLDDDLAKEVDLTFDELALQAKRDDEDLKKNRDFYPAVFRAALNETSIAEELGFE